MIVLYILGAILQVFIAYVLFLFVCSLFVGKAKKKTLSVMVLHGSGKLKTLCVFPSIFKGEHVKHTDMVEILTGHKIKGEYNRPTLLQIDGETILGVTSYTALSPIMEKVKKSESVITTR